MIDHGVQRKSVGQVLTKFWIPEGDSVWIQWGGP